MCAALFLQRAGQYLQKKKKNHEYLWNFADNKYDD